MGAVSPQRSPTKTKDSRLLLSAVVALVILLVVLLPVDAATTFIGNLETGVRLYTNDTLRSPDETKTLRVTEEGEVVITNETSTLWTSNWLSTSQRDNFYLQVNHEGQLGIYGSNGALFYQWMKIGDDSWPFPWLHLRDTGILHMYGTVRTGDFGKRRALQWTNMCGTVTRAALESDPRATLDFDDQCVFSSHLDSFMKLHRGGRLVTYTGYTPVNTFARPNGQGQFLVFNHTGSLSIDVDRAGVLGSLSDVVKYAKSLVSSSTDAVKQQITLLLRELYMVYDRLENVVLNPERFMDDANLIAGLAEHLLFLSNSVKDANGSSFIVDNLRSLSERVRNLRPDLVNPAFDRYILFKGTGTVDEYILSVTKDAKISIKTELGSEIWPNFPNNEGQ
ncbi:MAG: hypothetical protein J3Q66DRAFT_402531 [Benniella sp.]|nr:MAG: hypothetical protein J3Q66DRAFT_402531 [Benniella sp.]